MIYTNSVLRGYNASLGFTYLSLAYFFGSLAILELPSEDQLKVYDIDLGDIRILYGL